MFPAEFLICVHHCEIKKISSSGLIYQVSIIIEAVKIFIEVRQLGLSDVLVGAVCALFTHFSLLVHYQVFNEVLVAVTKLVLDRLGEPSILFIFICFELLSITSILLRESKKLFVNSI